MLSHLHVDHVGAVTEKNEKGEWVVVFDGTIHLSAKELAAWQHISADEDLARRFPHIPLMMQQTIQPILDKGNYKLIDDVETYDGLPKGIRLMSTPGHTPDHVAVIAEDGNEINVNVCDNMHTPMQFGRRKLQTEGNTNFPDSVKSRGKIEDFIEAMQRLGKKVSVVGPHFRKPVRLLYNRKGRRRPKITFRNIRTHKPR